MMTTYVVPDGTKRKPTAEEWAVLLENRLPELIRRTREGNYDPIWLNLTMQKVIEGTMIGNGEATQVVSPSTKSILQLIQSGLKLSATIGKRLISEATDTFPGWIDSDFENYGCNLRDEARSETMVDVHELRKNATLKQIFEVQGVPLNQLCLTQDQIIQFVEKYREWLCTNGCAALFLFKVGEKFFVASVGWSGARRLLVSVSRFSHGHVWSADDRHRVVLPQLTSVTSKT